MAGGQVLKVGRCCFGCWIGAGHVSVTVVLPFELVSFKVGLLFKGLVDVGVR